MKPSKLPTFAFLFWAAVAEYAEMKSAGTSSRGILGNFINKTLESLRPNLAGLYLRQKDFETGPQEFGSFMGNFTEVKLEGLEKFHVKTLRTNGFDITNLTVVEENFTAKGLYNINGSMAFPLGKTDIHLFGKGEFGAKFSNFSVSVKLKIRYENGTKVVKDFNLSVGLQSVQVYFRNLMGGNDLEKAFNQIINVVAVPVFDYYKEQVLDIVKLQVIEFINEMLKKKTKGKLGKSERYLIT